MVNIGKAGLLVPELHASCCNHSLVFFLFAYYHINFQFSLTVVVQSINLFIYANYFFLAISAKNNSNIVMVTMLCGVLLLFLLLLQVLFVRRSLKSVSHRHACRQHLDLLMKAVDML